MAVEPTLRLATGRPVRACSSVTPSAYLVRVSVRVRVRVRARARVKVKMRARGRRVRV